MRIRPGESIFFDFEEENGNDLKEQESSSWYIKDISNNIIMQSDNTITDSIIKLRIKREDTITLKSGTYVLLVSLSNNSTGYFNYILEEDLLIL